MHAGSRVLRRTKDFDVICAGQLQWKLASRGGSTPLEGGAPLRPSAGAANVALWLARHGLQVGLASDLPHDAYGRHFHEQLVAAGVDVGGVALAPPVGNLLVVDGRGEASPTGPEEQRLPFEVPAGWSSPLLLLSGVSPVVAFAAAMCKAARAARRAGAFVLLDFNAGIRTWAGRDPRTLRMVLREVDAARCSLADLAVVGMEIEAVRAALRPGAVLVVGDGRGRTVATGPFGEVAVVATAVDRRVPVGRSDAVTAAICVELVRASPGESAAARWHRALRGRHDART